MTDKKPKVKIFNALLNELHQAYVEMYKKGLVLEDDYNFVFDIEKAKFNKDIERLHQKFPKSQVLAKDLEVFPSEEKFWEYFPKLYSLGFKTKKEQKEFINNMDGLKELLDIDKVTSGMQDMLQNTELSSLSGLVGSNMDGVKKLLANPKFMKMAQKMAKDISEDKDLLDSLK